MKKIIIILLGIGSMVACNAWGALFFKGLDNTIYALKPQTGYCFYEEQTDQNKIVGWARATIYWWTEQNHPYNFTVSEFSDNKFNRQNNFSGIYGGTAKHSYNFFMDEEDLYVCQHIAMQCIYNNSLVTTINVQPKVQ